MVIGQGVRKGAKALCGLQEAAHFVDVHGLSNVGVVARGRVALVVAMQLPGAGRRVVHSHNLLVPVPHELPAVAVDDETPYRAAGDDVDHQHHEVTAVVEDAVVGVVDLLGPGDDYGLAAGAGDPAGEAEHGGQPAELKGHDFACAAGGGVGDVIILHGLVGVPVGQVLAGVMDDIGDRAERTGADQLRDHLDPRMEQHGGGGRGEQPEPAAGLVRLAEALVHHAGLDEEWELVRHGPGHEEVVHIRGHGDDQRIRPHGGDRLIVGGEDGYGVFFRRFGAAVGAGVDAGQGCITKGLQAADAPLAH